MSVPGHPDLPTPLGALTTETVRPELAELDNLSTLALVQLMAEDSRRATDAVARAAAAISRAVDAVADRLARGGRLVYVGAGSAGRLAVLDAAELGPTFDVPEGVVEAVMAGGEFAFRHAVEGAEDNEEGGAAEMSRLGVGQRDVVAGVSASGRTPFVVGALKQARSAGAATIAIACNPASPIGAVAEHVVEIVVGGEVIAGSSRLNAGTAQKIVLNILSTGAMVRLGKTYGNLMVDMRPTNSKLRDRAVRIVATVAEVEPATAARALEEAGWNTKLACLAAWTGHDARSVAPVLEGAHGKLRQAIAQFQRGER